MNEVYTFENNLYKLIKVDVTRYGWLNLTTLENVCLLSDTAEEAIAKITRLGATSNLKPVAL